MFPAVASMPTAYILAGVIMSLAFGFAAGNYACSLVFRLPRGRSLLEHKPYCGSCNTPLATIDLFPVFSALWLRHKCRYCGAHIPTSHFWTEMLIGLLFALCYLQFNFSERYLMVALVGIFWIILASIQTNDRMLMPIVLAVTAVFGMLNRTLVDHELFYFLIGGFYGLIIGSAIWYRQIKPVNHIFTLPDGAKILTLAGLCWGSQGLAFGLPFLLVLVLAFKLLLVIRIIRPVPLSVPAGFAVVLPLLFPDVLNLQQLIALLG